MSHTIGRTLAPDPTETTETDMAIRPTLLALAAGLALSGAACAQATDRPWYLGLGQDFTHDSNVLSSPSGSETSDTISTTTLRGGFNVPFGRQRAYGNATLNEQRFSNVDARNNSGYSLAAGLDWATVERLSGNFTLNSNKQLTDYNVGGITPVTLANIERTDEFNARVRVGMVTAVSLEAGLGQRQVSFSAPEYAANEYKQDSGNLGLSYRASGILTLGTGISAQHTRFEAPVPGQAAADSSDRRDLYVTATWVPTGASTVDARINYGKTEYTLATDSNFDGLTGALSWAWKPTGLLGLTTTLSRDTGQESGFQRLVTGSTVSASDFSQLTNALTVHATYQLSGKVSLTGGVGYARRDLVDRLSGATGNDATTALTIGANWAATRTMSFGCRASRESRTASGAGTSAYDVNRFSCSGQVVLD